ncbi:MAG: hypothetical protein OEY45_12680, partial [Gammaproteobacteria bacterium]|nr:hypothetical protein [Gammaproteobacteria bacterium]
AVVHVETQEPQAAASKGNHRDGSGNNPPTVFNYPKPETFRWVVHGCYAIGWDCQSVQLTLW